MTDEQQFWDQYLRHVDLDEVAGAGPEERLSAKLIERDEHRAAAIRLIRTPVGGGSPRGTHTHPFEQVFFILDGTMEIEIVGHRRSIGPGHLVVFPAGVEHRNWNESDKPTVHL